jgi:osmotically-inducible protein OsmY
VNADAVRNEVTLSGTVRTRAAREKAIELAKSAKPGVAVNDKIDVKPGV